jgi:hypothetical protein
MVIRRFRWREMMETAKMREGGDGRKLLCSRYPRRIRRSALLIHSLFHRQVRSVVMINRIHPCYHLV